MDSKWISEPMKPQACSNFLLVLYSSEGMMIRMLNWTGRHKTGWIVRIAAIVVLLIVSLSSPGLSEDLKIAVIDPDRVANETALGKRMKATLTKYLEARQKVIDTDEATLRGLEDELRTQGPLLSADAREAKQESYQREVIVYQQKVNVINRELQERRRTESDKYAKLLRAAVARVAKQGKFTLVLAKMPDSGLVLFHHGSLDITSQVIKELDRAGKTSKAEPKRKPKEKP
ncbi:MAG TPA: OmpH family outer membrane protein [Nitrospirales bacterium]|nr:OmpH family outer membrane protein [Nitrospirales bacterium]